MTKKSAAVLIATLLALMSLSRAHAQDYSLSHLTQSDTILGSASDSERTAKAVGVGRFPSDFFESSEASETTLAPRAASPAAANIAVLGGFASLLAAGSIITGLYVTKQRQLKHRVHVHIVGV